MNRPKLRLFGGIAILILLGILFGRFLLSMNTVVNGIYDLRWRASKIKAISSTVTNVVNLGAYSNMQELDEFTNCVGLASVASKGYVEDYWDGKPEYYYKGVIATVSGDKINYPDDYPEEQKIDAASMTEEFGVVFLEKKSSGGAGKSDVSGQTGETEKDGVNGHTGETEKRGVSGQTGETEKDGVNGHTGETEKRGVSGQTGETEQDGENVPAGGAEQDSGDTQSGDDEQASGYVVEYSRIKGDAYYIESEPLSAMEERSSSRYDVKSNVKSVESAFEIKIMLLSDQEGEDGTHSLMYISDDLRNDGRTGEDYGIKAGMLEKSFEDTASLDAETLVNHTNILKVGDDLYSVYIQRVKDTQLLGGGAYLVYLVPNSKLINMTYEQTSIVLGAFFVIGIVLLVWFFSAFRLVRHYCLNNEQAEEFRLGKMAKKAFSMIAIGCAVIIAVAALFLSLFRLLNVCNNVENSLSVMEKRVKESTTQKSKTIEEVKNTYVSYAEVIAKVLSDNPMLAEPETLKEFNDLIDADYIMIYDNSGKEVVSSSKYVDLVLGKTAESSTYEFRRLLKGIPVVTHDVAKDEETGLTNALIGVRLELAEDPGKYGALLIAVPKKKLTADNLEPMNDVMKSLVAEGSFAFSVDPEKKTIVNSSKSGMVGRNAVSLGLPEEGITDSYRDFFALSGKSCYGESKEVDGKVYYYAAEQSHIYKNVLWYAIIAAAAAFILLTVVIGFMLIGYRKSFEHWSKVGEVLDDPMNIVDDSESDTDIIEDTSKKLRISLSRNGLRTPVHNAMATLKILIIAAIAILGIRYMVGDTDKGSLMSFVMHGHWTKGLNLFSFTSVMILFVQVTIVVTVLQIILRIISASLGSKGETFCRLAQNLLTYGGVIAFVYMALYNIGVDLGPLLASLSLPAFALSLGAKDLITDIVAGISIVIDGEYKVGDIIEVNNYRGKVLEIGVRTTKLRGTGNNIKIIANRDIKNVLNMTRENSWYNLEIKVVTNRKLKEIEDVLIERLPKIKETVPGIISGPVYRGVIAIGGGAATLQISAECKETDFGNVQRELNQYIQYIFDEFDIATK